jgi:filamentous hemagglutinin family protein
MEHKKMSNNVKLQKSIALTTAIALVSEITASALAAPVNGVVQSGTANINTAGNTTTINQTTNRVDIKWDDFSSNAGDTINFNQPNANAVALNRVTSGVPSNLRGALNANGRVFVINNAGVTFHQGSTTNVGALAATTGDVTDVTTNSANPQYRVANPSNAAITNSGVIKASDGGFVYLLAKNINNTSTGQIASSYQGRAGGSLTGRVSSSSGGRDDS